MVNYVIIVTYCKNDNILCFFALTKSIKVINLLEKSRKRYG